MAQDRFDPDLLDALDPFEIDDDNRPNLSKWDGLTHEELLEAVEN